MRGGIPPRAHFDPQIPHDYRIVLTGSGTDKYPARQHAQAVVRHLEIAEGLIYLPGKPTVYLEDSDQTVPFRQRRYFFYLSGVNESDAHITYDVKRDHLTLYIQPVDPRKVIWFGRGSTVEEAENKYDIDSVRLSTSLTDDITRWVLRNPQRKIYALHKDQLPDDYPSTIPSSTFDTQALLPALNASRGIKSPHEISLIRRAVDLSSVAHRGVLHHITCLRNEAQIHALFVDICIAHSAKHQGYAPIVASGTHASTLHYAKNDGPLEGRGLVLVDAGSEWENYSSDITRTFPISAKGWASRESEEIYAIVEEMQERCVENLKPGVRYLDLHLLAHRIAVEGLMRLGILYQNDVEEVIKKGASQPFFPHGLGHHIGLEVHDVSEGPIMGLAEARQDMADFTEYGKVLGCPRGGAEAMGYKMPCTIGSPRLAPNMVLTVEPGVYFSKYALDKIYLPNPQVAQYINQEVLQRYMHVGGVRIEDDILITEDGYENLTTAPKGEEMLRVIREGANCGHGADCRFRIDSP
ncbi:MAG: Xaa-Pro aminopeptidase [Lasallia pustulata]|uniref:Xaa-Pro aminopeptidase n=1 Tax=Lasallia pustulata TaxID=136370 RepID=A0A5M8PUH1_9LECA|nr:MAG: Xaa-Pro aminopeptidase [Lasallia pustulata]